MVLLVEDSPADATLLRVQLERAGRSGPAFTVVHHSYLESALAEVERARYDVLLLDLNLPDSRGLDTVRRAMALAPDVPLVVLTGINDEEMGEEALVLGAQDYLVKGFLDEVLLARSIRFSIGRHHMRSALAAAARRLQESQARLERSEGRLRMVVEHLTDGVALLDEVGHVLVANPKAREALELLGAGSGGDTVTQIGGHRLADLIRETARSGFSELATQPPFERVFEASVRLLDAAQGSSPLRCLVLRDVTRARATRRRAALRERLAAIGQVSAGLVHDLSNELQCVAAGAALLATADALGEVEHGRAVRLREHAERATGLARRLVDIGHSKERVLGPVDVCALVREWAAGLRDSFPADVDLRIETCRDAIVRGDRTQLVRVLTNLGLNACEAMEGGGEVACVVDVEQVERPTPVPGMEPGPWAAIHVADSGPGIPPDVLERVFEPLFTTRPSGTGMGLAQVYRLVRAHGGYVDVGAGPAGGARFSLYLPLDNGNGADAGPAADEPVPRGEGELILVVEDEADLRELLADELRHLGYRPLLAGDGRRALKLFDKHADEIAAVLTDVVMPGMSGEELGRTMHGLRPDLPVALVSAHDLESRARELSHAGIAGWFKKPLELRRLATGLRGLLEQR